MGIFALREEWMRIYFFRDSWIYIFLSSWNWFSMFSWSVKYAFTYVWFVDQKLCHFSGDFSVIKLVDYPKLNVKPAHTPSGFYWCLLNHRFDIFTKIYQQSVNMYVEIKVEVETSGINWSSRTTVADSHPTLYHKRFYRLPKPQKI